MFYASLKIKIPIIFILLSFYSKGQTAVTDTTAITDFAISYAIDINSGSKKLSVSETYTGGSKTIFITKDRARIRLMSLMRIESIYFLPSSDSTSSIFRIKESSKKATPEELSVQEWKQLNNKYDSARCELITGATKKILDYDCKKAVIHLADGRKITAYYTPEVNPLQSIYEPAFANVPGLVLEYSYTYKDGTSTYTATSIVRESIDPDIFVLKSKHPDKIKM